MSSAMGGRPENEPMEVDADKYVDTNSFNVVQGLLAQLQQEHERLMGTAAHLSHELDVNKEHVKVGTVCVYVCTVNVYCLCVFIPNKI